MYVRTCECASKKLQGLKLSFSEILPWAHSTHSYTYKHICLDVCVCVYVCMYIFIRAIASPLKSLSYDSYSNSVSHHSAARV